MIDFSTLQGLTIPEGVVAQITDASGRVLWSAAPQESTLFLRPCAQSNSSHFSPYPTSLSGIHAAVSEEVADDDATYITAKVSQSLDTSGIRDVTVRANMQFDGEAVDFTGSVVSGFAIIRRSTENDPYYSFVINGVYYYQSNSETLSDTTANGYTDVRVVMPETAISAINEYISQHNKLPNIQYNFSYTVQNTKTVTYKVTQVYLSLTCQGR